MGERGQSPYGALCKSRGATMIVQARKRGNRLPTTREWSILRCWEQAGGLSIAKWIGAD
jgi:hypothetical protein